MITQHSTFTSLNPAQLMGAIEDVATAAGWTCPRNTGNEITLSSTNGGNWSFATRYSLDDAPVPFLVWAGSYGVDSAKTWDEQPGIWTDFIWPHFYEEKDVKFDIASGGYHSGATAWWIGENSQYHILAGSDFVYVVQELRQESTGAASLSGFIPLFFGAVKGYNNPIKVTTCSLWNMKWVIPEFFHWTPWYNTYSWGQSSYNNRRKTWCRPVGCMFDGVNIDKAPTSDGGLHAGTALEDQVYTTIDNDRTAYSRDDFGYGGGLKPRIILPNYTPTVAHLPSVAGQTLIAPVLLHYNKTKDSIIPIGELPYFAIRTGGHITPGEILHYGNRSFICFPDGDPREHDLGLAIEVQGA